MTIGIFENLMNGIADVVFVDNKEKETFKLFVLEVNNDVFEKMGDDGIEEPFTKDINEIQRNWSACVEDDDRMKFIGNRVFEAYKSLREAVAASYGG